MSEPPHIAVLIPCLDEAMTVAKVIGDFRRALPDAAIFVYDNGSSDDTVAVARAAGAQMGREKRRGKGYVVATMFDEVDADLYVLVDGDDTYPAEEVHALLQPVLDGRADMVVGNRLRRFAEGSFRPAHQFGNRLVVGAINLAFGSRLEDVMSGYRVLRREVVERVPVVSRGFEIETELTLQTLRRDFVITEVPIPYRGRPPGSHSKLNTLRDGVRVLVKIVDVLKAYRPLLFFFMLGVALALVGAALGAAPMVDVLATGHSARVLPALLAVTAEVIAVMLVVCGLVLDGLNHRLEEVERAAQKSHRTRRQAAP